MALQVSPAASEDFCFLQSFAKSIFSRSLHQTLIFFFRMWWLHYKELDILSVLLSLNIRHGTKSQEERRQTAWTCELQSVRFQCWLRGCLSSLKMPHRADNATPLMSLSFTMPEWKECGCLKRLFTPLKHIAASHLFLRLQLCISGVIWILLNTLEIWDLSHLLLKIMRILIFTLSKGYF